MRQQASHRPRSLAEPYRQFPTRVRFELPSATIGIYAISSFRRAGSVIWAKSFLRRRLRLRSNSSERRLMKSRPKINSLNSEASILPRRMSAALRRKLSSWERVIFSPDIPFRIARCAMPGQQTEIGSVDLSEIAVGRAKGYRSRGPELLAGAENRPYLKMR